jgi:ABC-type sugar transport system ATPase subunit
MRATPVTARIVVMTSSPLLSSQSPAIESRGLGKSFGSRAALEGVDLVVSRGVAFGFLGANGAGKTTLIRLLLGLAKPTAGSLRVLGRDVPEDRASALARVGAIIEEPRFHQHLTGRQNLRVHAAACGTDAHGRMTLRSRGSASPLAPTRRSRPTRSGCVSASAWRAAS